MPSDASGGLPPRIYLPIVVVIAAIFLCTMAYLVADGFGVTGSVFGKARNRAGRCGGAAAGFAERRRRRAARARRGGSCRRCASASRRIPNDDVALTQLGDMYLAANHFEQAIPLYQRALRANPQTLRRKPDSPKLATALARQQ